MPVVPLFLMQAVLCFCGALILKWRWARVLAACLGVVEIILTLYYIVAVGK